MTLDELIAREEAKLADLLSERAKQTTSIGVLRDAISAADSASEDDERAVSEALEARVAVDARIDAAKSHIESLRAEAERDAEVDRLQSMSVPTQVRKPSYDRVARVGAEGRTYDVHKDATFDTRTGQFKRGAKPGADFQSDVVAAFLGDYGAQARLAKHQEECRRDGQMVQRAVGTGAFAGLTVPQYLTDIYAPAAAARRPFADAIRQRPLPASGMTVNLSRITTSTATALQASENAAVQNTDIDDTLLTINVQTNAGQQDVSRQALERGTGIEDVVLDDLFRQYATVLDSTLINQATNGLVNVATSVTYTDASPTAAELYPKVLEGLAGIEAALLDQASGENIAVMHSRRWYWMQSQVGTSWPFVAQPGYPAQQGAANLATVYGSGERGILPNGTPVIVDNNVPTNLGAGNNEDRVFLVDRNECHLWEDPSAPMLIRAEQTNAGSLGVKLVVYGYFAYTHARYAHSRQVSGTGLITPTF